MTLSGDKEEAWAWPGPGAGLKEGRAFASPGGGGEALLWTLMEGEERRWLSPSRSEREGVGLVLSII